MVDDRTLSTIRISPPPHPPPPEPPPAPRPPSTAVAVSAADDPPAPLPTALDVCGLASVLLFSSRRNEDKVSRCSLCSLLRALVHGLDL